MPTRRSWLLSVLGINPLVAVLAIGLPFVRYQEIWTLLYALILLCAAADLWSSLVRRHYTTRGTLTLGTLTLRPAAMAEPFIAGSLLLAAALVPLSAWWASLDPTVLWAAETIDIAGQLSAEAWPPTLGTGGLAKLVRLSTVTLAMSVLAIVVAMIGGVLLAFPAANMSGLTRDPGARGQIVGVRLVVLAATRALRIVLRAIPPPIWALLLLLFVYPGLVPRAMALGTYTVWGAGGLMAETTENIDQRPLRALRAHGASAWHGFSYGVIPQWHLASTPTASSAGR